MSCPGGEGTGDSLPKDTAQLRVRGCRGDMYGVVVWADTTEVFERLGLQWQSLMHSMKYSVSASPHIAKTQYSGLASKKHMISQS